MFTNKIVKRLQDSVIVMYIMGRKNILGVIISLIFIIIGRLIISGEVIFNYAPYRHAHNTVESTTW